jgi:Xaa-Pro aminopeptidase
MNGKEVLRAHDAPTPQGWAEFMKTGWAPSPLDGITPTPALAFTGKRRDLLSAQFPGVRLVIPAGSFKTRSNDTDYRFRAHSAFLWLTGITASDAVPDSVLVLEPTANGHEALLFIHPRSNRDTDEFYRSARHGEFWVGRRMTKEETETKYGIAVRQVDTLIKFLDSDIDTYVLRGDDADVDGAVKDRKKRDPELAACLSQARLIKDSFEIAELQAAVDSTNRGFADMVRVFPAATSTKRGERIIEAAFFGRARLEGNELGYDSIIASGSHGCILHWIRNDGDV